MIASDNEQQAVEDTKKRNRDDDDEPDRPSAASSASAASDPPARRVWVPSNVQEACYYNHLDKLTELVEGASASDAELLRLLSESAPVLGSRASKTPLVWAFGSRDGKSAAFEYLHGVLRERPDAYKKVINTVDGEGGTLAQYASTLEDFELMVAAGADLNVGGQGSTRGTPLENACQTLFGVIERNDGALPTEDWPPSLVDFLVGDGKCDVNYRGRFGVPTLHNICSRPECGAHHIVDLLLRLGADPTIQDDEGRTALHHLMLSDYTNDDSCRSVLAWLETAKGKGGNGEPATSAPVSEFLDLKDNDGATALALALEVQVENEAPARLLVKAGASRDGLDEEAVEALESILSSES